MKKEKNEKNALKKMDTIIEKFSDVKTYRISRYEEICNFSTETSSDNRENIGNKCLETDLMRFSCSKFKDITFWNSFCTQGCNVFKLTTTEPH